MKDDTTGVNAFLYTVSKIAQKTVMKKLNPQDPGRVESKCRKNMYRVEGRIPVIRSH